jgi:two-component system cell cycle response regulator
MDGITQDRVLAWMHAMLVADSLQAFAGLAAQGAGDAAESTVGALVLADPGHELRALLHGDGGTRFDSPAPVFVDSLVGVAPQCAALHTRWSGEYCAADHALLLPETAGMRHIVMLPLQRRGQLVGVYCLGSRRDPPALASLDPPWAAQVAATMAATLERLFDRARLLRSGMTDPLTGWQPRRYLHARLGEEIARNERYATSATCIVIDIDRLRGVNERHGLPAGDRALHEVGARLESQVRSSDSMAHLGGDQFAVLLPATAAAQAVPLVERILAVVRASPVELGPGIAAALTVSIGIASAPAGAIGDRKAAADQWLAEAESALHRAKRSGGDGWEISSAGATSAPGK